MFEGPNLVDFMATLLSMKFSSSNFLTNAFHRRDAKPVNLEIELQKLSKSPPVKCKTFENYFIYDTEFTLRLHHTLLLVYGPTLNQIHL